jgi:Phytanoyl-CoA dioxygenase (PhyH)
MTTNMQTSWIHATPATSKPDAVLTPAQVQMWRENGYTFVDGLFPNDLIEALRDDAIGRFPPAGSAEAERITDFGSAGRLNFPAESPAFNAVTLHPRLLCSIGQLLGVPETGVRLTQSDLWPKYGRTTEHSSAADNDDQRMHVDYPNHTLAHPTPWRKPEAVELIVYLSHVEDCGGATAVVARTGPDDPAYRWPIVDSPGIADLDWINDRTRAEAAFAERRPHLAPWREALYAREQRVHYKPGDTLLYRHDTWHRGTPLIPGRLRLAHNITYRKASAEWISTLHVGWAWSAYRRDKLLEKLIASASLEQRAVLGFPQPGSDFWDADTVAAIEARYGVFGMDLTPYRAGREHRE